MESYQQIAGFLKVRVNGHVIDITSGMKLDRYKHTILRLWLIEWLLNPRQIMKTLELKALIPLCIMVKMYLILDQDSKVRYFSRNLMCPSTGISYQNPEPNLFSFNSQRVLVLIAMVLVLLTKLM
jgi:excinuclease ABC subunit A